MKRLIGLGGALFVLCLNNSYSQTLQSVTDSPNGYFTSHGREIQFKSTSDIFTFVGGGLPYARIGAYGNAGWQNLIINEGGGNVGIGTASPTYKLDVNGEGKFGAYAIIGTQINQGFYQDASNGAYRSINSANNGFYFQNYAGVLTSMFVGLDGPYAGRVGIGFTTPAYTLDVNGSTKANAFLSTTNANSAGFQLRNTSGTLRWGIGGSGTEEVANKGFDYSIFRYDDGGNYINADLVIKRNTGNIGIGTSEPGSYKLAVEGTVGARKVKVTGEIPWADYVFDSSYNLAPLSHVEKFIKENKHLPEVPSATEVKKDGLDLGDNQAVLLKKIEELTLYIIQQNKQIDQQNKKIEHMGKELEAVKAIQLNSGQR